MRTNTGITIAICGALSIFLCAEAGLRAQGMAGESLPAATMQDSANDLYVAVGKSVLVDTAKPISRVSIGLGGIADVQATTPNEVMVDGAKPGQTSLIIWDTQGGRQFFNVTVRASVSVLDDKLEGVRRELALQLPGQDVEISSEDGTIFLRGTVKNLDIASRAAKIASVAGTVVNLLSVDVPASKPQILLKVRFMSVDRTREKQLGVNLSSTGALNTTGSLTTGEFGTTSSSSGSSSSSSTSPLNLIVESPGDLAMGLNIQALEQKIGAQVLAEPNLLAADGKQASFLAGGEYPYPMVQGGSGGSGAAVTIEFKEYGIRLNFIPTITPRGTIRLQVAPEVSALDFADAVTISGFTVPAITTRKVNTEVELADGQSFVIGGLLDNTVSDTFMKIPFLGDIPVLGKFFQSIQKTKANTELIVVVTPEIVSPIPAGEPTPTLKFPGKFLSPNSSIPMHTPDAKTSANTLSPPPPSMPIEKLIESMKPETPLTTGDGTGTTGGGGSTGASTGSGSSGP